MSPHARAARSEARADGGLLVGSADHALFAFGSFATGHTAGACPAIGNGYVVFASGDGNVYSIGK